MEQKFQFLAEPRPCENNGYNGTDKSCYSCNYIVSPEPAMNGSPGSKGSIGCKESCQQTPGCAYFQYRSGMGSCLLTTDPSSKLEPQSADGSNYVSGNLGCFNWWFVVVQCMKSNKNKPLKKNKNNYLKMEKNNNKTLSRCWDIPKKSFKPNMPLLPKSFTQ